MEHVTDLNEAKILGYFESVQGTFLTKLIVLIGCTRLYGAEKRLNTGALDAKAVKEVEACFPDATFYKALALGNVELLDNLAEDLVTSGVLAGWAVFEQVMKDATQHDYVLEPQKLHVDLDANRLGLSQEARRDLKLFYYIRNAIAHYNGAYFSAKSIDHVYRGVEFKSAGNEGLKIETSIQVTWEMLQDLERHATTVWSAANSPARARDTSRI